MECLDDEIQSSRNSSFSSTSSELIMKRIKQATIKIDTDGEQKQLSGITLKTQSKAFPRNAIKKSSPENSLIRKINTARNTIMQENFYGKQCQENKRRSFNKNSIISQDSEKTSKSELYNRRRNRIYRLDSDDSNDDERESSNVLHLKKPLVNKENETVYYKNYGRMEPIDWSIINNEKKTSHDEQNFKMIEDENKNETDALDIFGETSKILPEANIQFINFVNNSMTDKTVYNAAGNIDKVSNATESPFIKMQRMINEPYDISNINIPPDIKKAFEPCEPKFHTTNLIDSYVNNLEFVQNEKNECNNTNELEQKLKISDVNNENNHMNKPQAPNQLEDAKQNAHYVNNTKKKGINDVDEVDDLDDVFSFVKLDKKGSSTSTNSVESNQNKITTIKTNIKSENCTKNSYYNRLKKISNDQSSSFYDIDDSSQLSKNLGTSANKQINQCEPKFKEYNDVANTKCGEKVGIKKVELKNNESIMKETYNKIFDNSTNKVNCDETDVKNTSHTSNDEAYIKSQKSRYFLKLSNLVEKITYEEEHENNLLKRTCNNSTVENNVKYNDKSECDTTSSISSDNSNIKCPVSIKDAENCKDEVSNNMCNVKNDSVNLDLVSKYNLDLDDSVDSEEEYDFVNFENFGPFISLLNNLKSFTDAQKSAIANVASIENTEKSENLTSLSDAKLANSSSEVPKNNEMHSNSSNSSLNNKKNVKNNECQQNASENKENINLKKSSNPTSKFESKRRKKMLDALNNYKTNNASELIGEKSKQFIDTTQNNVSKLADENNDKSQQFINNKQNTVSKLTDKNNDKSQKFVDSTQNNVSKLIDEKNDKSQQFVDNTKNNVSKLTNEKNNKSEQFIDNTEENLINNKIKDRHWILDKIKKLNLHKQCKSIDEAKDDGIEL